MRWEWLAILVVVAIGIGVLVFRMPEPEAPSVHGDTSKVSLIPADLDAIEKEIRRNKGKVVLVEFWATWCGPCRFEFPRFVRLHESLADRGLVCISVSLERNPEVDRGEALSFLQSRDATMTNLLFTERTERGGDGLVTKFGYPGFIPYAALFSRSGERLLPGDGNRFEHSELRGRIEQELEKAP